MKKYFWRTVLFIPLLLSIYFSLLKPLYIILFGTHTKGTIVDFDYTQHDEGGGATYYAVVEYRREDGNIYTAKIGDDTDFDFNKSVKLYYLENSGEEAIAKDISHFAPFFFCLFFYFWFFLIVFLNKKFPKNNISD